MLFLIGEIIGYLIVALILGLVGGWVLRGLTSETSSISVESRWKGRVEEAEALREKFRAERDELRQKVELLQENLSSNEGKREMQKAELASLRADLSEFSDTGDELSRTRSELLSLKQQLRTAKDTAASYRSQLELKARETAEYRLQYEKTLQQLNANKKKFSEELEALTNREARSGSTDSMVAQLESLLTEREERIRSLENELGSLVEGSPAQSTNDGEPAGDRTGMHTSKARSHQEITVDREPAWLIAGDVENADDLKRIKGIGPVLESTLNSIGIHYFSQISRMSDSDIRWISDQIGTFPKRIVQDRWVQQAAALASEQTTG